MKISCMVLNEKKKWGNLFPTLKDSLESCHFSSCNFEHSCISLNHTNFRYSFLFLIKRTISSLGNPINSDYDIGESHWYYSNKYEIWIWPLVKSNMYYWNNWIQIMDMQVLQRPHQVSWYHNIHNIFIQK